MARSPWTSGRKPRPVGGKPTVAWVAKSFGAESEGGDGAGARSSAVADASVDPIWRRRNEENRRAKDLQRWNVRGGMGVLRRGQASPIGG